MSIQKKKRVKDFIYRAISEETIKMLKPVKMNI